MKGNSLKKIVLLIWCLLGVVCAWASPFYRGAQVPVATMTSTSSMICSSFGKASVQTNAVQKHGFYTSASTISGGQTTLDTHPRHGGVRRNFPLIPGLCEHCHWVQDENENWYCSDCGCTIYGGCDCDPCHCPVEFDWKALLFLTAAAGVYMAKKTKKSRGYALLF